MVTPNNPAGRLHMVLRKAVEIPPNTNQGEAWRKLLDIKGASIAVLLEHLAHIIRMPMEVKTAIEALGDRVNQELCLRWMPRVEQAFSQLSFAAQWERVRTHFDPATLSYLEIASDQLSRLAPEPVPNADELAEILADIRSLVHDVQKADLAPDVRQFVLDHLGAAEAAIRDVRFRGMAALHELVVRTIGDAAFHPQVRVREPEVVSRFWRTFARIAIVVELTVHLLQISDPIRPLLLPEGTDAPVARPSAPEEPGAPEVLGDVTPV